MPPLNLPPVKDGTKGYRAEIVADSISNYSGRRVTTMLWKYPLIVHAEACRHRAFARSVGSNRAIPTNRIIQMVEEDPFTPTLWPINEPGMQSQQYYEVGGVQHRYCDRVWAEARRCAIEQVQRLVKGRFAYQDEMYDINVHKQIANRLLGPYQWVTEIVTADDQGYANYFALRNHHMAQGELRTSAELAYRVYSQSKPQTVALGGWHLPFITDDEREYWDEHKAAARDEPWLTCNEHITRARQKLRSISPTLTDDTLWVCKAISAARCARTSYRTHDGKETTVAEDLQLYLRLMGSNPVHASPTEHQVRAMLKSSAHSRCNLHGWITHRQEFPGNTTLVYTPPVATGGAV